MAITRERAQTLLGTFPSLSVLVVGDVMLDEFVIGKVHRISPEAPVPVVGFERARHRLGGAANVAYNVRTLGARVDLVGVVGNDAAAGVLNAHLDEASVDHAALVMVSDRPTTRKVRVVTTANQQVARIDYESDRDVVGAVERALCKEVSERIGRVSIVVVSDYAKGVVTPGVMRVLSREAAARGVPVVVDPKIPHLELYAGATVVTPNHHEAEAATGLRVRDLDDARVAAREFRKRTRCQSVLVTWGEQGMWVLEACRPPADGGDGEADVVNETYLPAVAREVADVTGAGDTVVAGVALGCAAGGSLAEAAVIANHAAGIVVGRFGPATVTADELLASFES
jgi:D-beta-D-heptose 7-phosphate kinase/D-beta-D-heptose 1-phosphate adenosyltransferase